MDSWSPRTKLKYGLCQLDDSGKIVSIWNFGDLDEVLREFDECGESSDQSNAARGDIVDEAEGRDVGGPDGVT